LEKYWSYEIEQIKETNQKVEEEAIYLFKIDKDEQPKARK
jgi:hypothetical protein